ncbi:MAG: hypothetical protein ABT03_02380 [Comamonas sp. SCN 67-35]|uniref:hypothetical protein n=1 Tax=unclassified Comamonas TaxID=2638500 RepID=UPI00086D8363|nr:MULTISPECIES: hypothetical protein [unclassified Comamonas]MBN9329458.1 hypothetical protein [Comamonas sp.]ODU39744.1 MAG: hypothetical protein ABT03_02380 [Comamonas sp. SCN 67-35]OJW95977.1 MAG: hypothetical protein BGO73_15055 [Burkholderiales bacterium 66-26]
MAPLLGAAQELKPEDFLRGILPKHIEGSMPYAVLSNAQGVPNRLAIPKLGEDYAAFLARVLTGQCGAYFTPATFRADKDGKRRRGKHFAVALRGLWVDIEGTEAKGGYNGQRPVLQALLAFCKATGLRPTMIVLTSSGGAHAYFTTTENMDPETWQAGADALVNLARAHGFRIDIEVTQDRARILRMPGSIHQKTGGLVRAYRTGEPYETPHLFKLLNVGAGHPDAGRFAAYVGVNDELGLDDEEPRHAPFDMLQVARHCAAIRLAIRDNGARTPYGPWLLAIRTAALSVEGDALAHEVSRGHPRYDPEEVDRKLSGLTGGPPSCDTWHAAWGSESPCTTCTHWGGLTGPGAPHFPHHLGVVGQAPAAQTYTARKGEK